MVPSLRAGRTAPVTWTIQDPKKEEKEKKSTFVSMIQTIGAPLPVDTGPHFSLSLLEVSRPEPKERVLPDPSTPPKDHVADSPPSPPCPVGVPALHTGSGWTGLNKTHQPRPLTPQLQRVKLRPNHATKVDPSSESRHIQGCNLATCTN